MVRVKRGGDSGGVECHCVRRKADDVRQAIYPSSILLDRPRLISIPHNVKVKSQKDKEYQVDPGICEPARSLMQSDLRVRRMLAPS